MQVYEACLARAWRLSDAVLPQLRRATDAATSLAAEGEAAKTELRRCEKLTAAAEAEVTQANLRLSRFRRERAQSEVALLAAHAKGQHLEEALAEARGDNARLVKAAEAAGLELQVLLPLPSLQVILRLPVAAYAPLLELQEAGWQHERHESTIAATQHEADEAAKALERLQKRWANDCAMLEKVDDELAQARLVHTNPPTTKSPTHHSHLPTPTRLSLSQLSLSLNSLSQLSQLSQLPPTGARVDCEA